MAKRIFNSCAANVYRMIFKNARLFLVLVLLSSVICCVSFGVNDETMIVISTLLFVMVWLVSLFFARQLLAGKKVKFRDGLYNAMTPIVSTFVVAIVLLIQCIPIIALIIAYSAAVETHLFNDMFYGSLFVLFAIVMVAISVYLLSGTSMALIAVSAPGMYPLKALQTTHDVMTHKRFGFMVEVLKILLALLPAWLLVVGPAILIQLALQNFAGVVIPGFLQIIVFVISCFSIVYVAVYLYMYYRKVIKYDKK